ncbi:hypothetical protein C8246_12790 [Paracidovorax avenae]|uniref:hypothetical protein n=1 Tax=Paracidovorax avenae TaxID=80867 RepID=UPI000D15F7D2|nr:hypothetical protein [Paracidovorax avenae]AVS92519.1 hypothetical protein C8246_12790 [Paracidovorax avenae]AVS97817.1 hypothetical protein C8236_02530 [Paracidovorax avenae]AVT04857.1 hypothetical protein C8248_01810 [Paracidovorax avenae]AVT19005.1 hypothetical protein C7Y68_02550 [Paracidovorax avenae]
MMPAPTDASPVRSRGGWGRRLRTTAVPAAGARLPLLRARALASAPVPGRGSLAGASPPMPGDGAAGSPARQLLERFQFCELDAMPHGRLLQVVEFLGGRGRALRTAPLRANWKALRLALEEPALRALMLERTDEVVEFLLRPGAACDAGQGAQALAIFPSPELFSSG